MALVLCIIVLLVSHCADVHAGVPWATEAGRVCQYLNDCPEFPLEGCDQINASTCVSELARADCSAELDTIVCPAVPYACGHALTWGRAL